MVIVEVTSLAKRHFAEHNFRAGKFFETTPLNSLYTRACTKITSTAAVLVTCV